MRTASEQETATLIYENIVLQFGCPVEILTDRGPRFMGHLLEDYLNILKAKHMKRSAYHPRTNGMVKRLNGTIKRAISKLVSDDPTLWDEYVGQKIFTCRTMPQARTQFTPLKLLYGVDPRMHGDSKKPILFDKDDQERVLEYQMHELEALEQMRAAALERARLNALRWKLYFDGKCLLPCTISAIQSC